MLRTSGRPVGVLGAGAPGDGGAPGVGELMLDVA
jgi:hypothetical protein